MELIEFASRKDPIMDQNPSSILLYIQDLSGDSKEAFERQVLLNRLPKSVRTTLSTSSAANNAEFAKEADQVMRAYKLALKNSSPSSSSVAAVSVSPEDSSPEVAAVSRSGASAASGSSGSSGPSGSGLCGPHARYGARAYSCRSARCPMRAQFQQRNQASRRPGNGGAGRQ